MKYAPMTRNAEAARLIEIAQDRCPACRRDWRLYPPSDRHQQWHHRAGYACTAQQERAELRRIGAETRRRKE